MNLRIFPSVCLFLALPIIANGSSGPIMKEIRFSGASGGGAKIEFLYSGKAEFKIKQLPDFDQIVVEANGITLPAKLTKSIDASLSQTPVVQITPYLSGAATPGAKIIIQLKEKVSLEEQRNSGKFALAISPKMRRSAQIKNFDTAGAVTDTISVRASATSKYETSVQTAQDLIKTLETPAEERVYTGRKVDFEAANEDVYNIFKLVGDASGLNIVAGSDVKGTISLSLKSVPWDQLLDIVLQQLNLKATATGNVVHITTMDSYTKAQESKKKAIIVNEELEPTIMAIIPVSFAKASELKKMIGELLFQETVATRTDEEKQKQQTELQQQQIAASLASSGKTAMSPEDLAKQSASKIQSAFLRGKIEVDERSNSLVVTNTKETVERIRKLVKELDVALPQVLIDSKIVIASENWAKTVGVTWAGRATTNGQGRAGVGFSFNEGQIQLQNSATNGPAFSVTSKAGTGASGFQVGSGTHGNLGLQLSLGETNGLTKTIASPRIIVNNKQSATVSDGTQLTFLTSGGVSSSGQLETVDAGLTLTVTPQITNSGSVLMDLSIAQRSPTTNRDIDNKSVQTQVLVESGSTMVLGGIYTYSSQNKEDGIPLLKDLPFVGQLFRTNSDNWGRGELMVFVTPKIMEPGDSGAPAPL